MIIPQTVLSVLDNSGVKEVRCVQMVNKNYKKFGSCGSLFIGVVCSLKSGTLKNSFKKGNLVKCLVVQTKKATGASSMLNTGFYYKFSKNGAIILRSKKKVFDLASSRLQIVGSFLLKQKGFFKCYDLSFKNI